MGEPRPSRRRRVRAGRPAAAGTPESRPLPERRRTDDEDRGLRGLIGAGPTQVSVSDALRARDAARPTPQDLQTAERDLVIVRRNYSPPSSGSGGSAPARS